MHFRKLLMVAVVATVPLGLVIVSAGSASASSAAKAPKVPKGTGTVVCGVAGSATFTPPLTPGGTPGVSHEEVTFSLTAVNCTGPTNTPGSGPTSGTITTKAIRVKDAKVGKTRVAGACYIVPFDPKLVLRSKVAWAPISVKTSRLKIALSWLSGQSVTTGLVGTGTSKGSYAGSSSLTLNIGDLADLIALQNTCTDGDAGTSVASIRFFSPNASLTVG